MKKDIKILIIDDEEIMRSLFTDIFQDLGYSIIAVADGIQAHQKIKDMFFDIAFVDIHMPVMDGVQTIRLIKKVSPKTSIVMMDSFYDALLEEAKNEGAITCIHKPFHIRQVIDVFQDTLKVKQGLGHN